jgi:trehalose 6-phosphate synthase
MAPRAVVIASNRGPLAFRVADDGSLVGRRGAGGLVSGLLPIVAGTDTVWLAAALSDADRRAAHQGTVEAEGVRARLLDLPDDVLGPAYDVVGNATLWFVHHGLFDLARRPRFDAAWHEAWDAFCVYNHRFAEALAETAPEGAAVLLQDYHLALVGSSLTVARPDLRTVHFSHTPFAGPDLLRILPTTVRRELLAGMAANAACGFHTERWRQGFQSACDDADIAPPTTFVAPLGPDPDDLARAAADPACQKALDDLATTVGGRSVIARVDRIEPSKNVVRGFLAYDTLLDRYPEHRDQVVFVASLYPSREGLAEYLAYRQEVEAAVHRINQRWATSGWQPIVLDERDHYPTSVAALRCYDVLLVNPVRDGLNLVAKEGPLVNERSGTVVLSTEAGSHAELADHVVSIDPCDLTGTADALHRALTDEPATRASRATALVERIRARTAADWFADLIAAAG